MKKKLVFMLMMASMGTSWAKSITSNEETTMKMMKEGTEDSEEPRYTTSVNSFNPDNTEG